MKIRTGFVSNSSSASFTIKTKLTPAELFSKLIPMLLTRKKKIWKDEWTGERTQYFLKQKQEVDKMIEENSLGSYTFHGTINYDTTIWQSDSETLVMDTCNNEGFGDYFDFIEGIDSWESSNED